MPQRERYVSPTTTFDPYFGDKSKTPELVKRKKLSSLLQKTKHYFVKVKRSFKNKNFKGFFIATYVGDDNFILLGQDPNMFYKTRYFKIYKKIKTSKLKKIYIK